ncbi:WD40-repeat-containing domain protein [Zychaea mexicana]|uniref:WD40-repeat-containing domain protein n=1 Tax=Zychaea mexicana TaxID=64656 RepID=UPI0022FE21EF|nr:WD40-repeat-containing domain protein [Zychaea mexicana]KAI9472924.1 WD40-repeat-containing domain protein [Zychaea mexicana]
MHTEPKITFSNLYKHNQSILSPDASYVASVVDHYRLVIRSHTIALTILHVFECVDPIQQLKWSPNSKYIMTVNHDRSTLQVWSLIDVHWRAKIRDESLRMHRVWWSADSSSILCSDEFKLRISVWMLADQQVRYIRYPKFVDKGCEISPDKNYVAIVENRQGKDGIGIYTWSASAIFKHIVTDTNDLCNIRWSPDSQFLAAWDNCLYYKLLVYGVDGSLHASYQAYEHGLGIKSITWSPDSSLLAVGSYDQKVRILRTSDWKPIIEFFHPSTLDQKFQKSALVYHQDGSAKFPAVSYHPVLKRPFNIPILRPEYNTPYPKIGVGYCQFNANGKFLCTRDDSMPTAYWIWDISQVECCMIVLQQQAVKQLAWHPRDPYTLAVTCGNQHVYLTTQRGCDGYIDGNNNNNNNNTNHNNDNDGDGGGGGDDDDDHRNPFELGLVPVPAADFVVRKLSWSQDGESLLLIDTGLYCLAQRQKQNV